MLSQGRRIEFLNVVRSTLIQFLYTTEKGRICHPGVQERCDNLLNFAQWYLHVYIELSVSVKSISPLIDDGVGLPYTATYSLIPTFQRFITTPPQSNVPEESNFIGLQKQMTPFNLSPFIYHQEKYR